MATSVLPKLASQLERRDEVPNQELAAEILAENNKAAIKELVQNLSNKKRYIKPFTTYIDGIITNTKSIKEVYEGFGWFPEKFIHVIYNGIDLPENVKPVDVKQLHGFSNESKIIFSAGRLDAQKGFDLLIEVAALAKSNHPEWKIVIAGEGKLKEELHKKSTELQVSDMAHFIGFSDQIPSLLQASDIFALPSRYEGMPNALLEAMAMGKASVATSVNGAPELVEDGISGYLVESENVTQLHDRIEQLLADDPLRETMGFAARKRVKDHFTIDRMIDQLEKLFQHQLEKAD